VKLVERDIHAAYGVKVISFRWSYHHTRHYKRDAVANTASPSNNSRDFAGDPAAGTAGDLGPEGLTFIPTNESLNGRPLLVVAHEVSGSTAIYQINVQTTFLPMLR